MLGLQAQAPESLELFIKSKNDYYQKMPNSRKYKIASALLKLRARAGLGRERG